MVGLTIHALSERSIAGCSLAVTSKLIHVVGIVWAAIVGVVVWVTSTMAMLRVLALCAMSLTGHSCWVRGVVSAVLGVAISALRLVYFLVYCSQWARSSGSAAVLTRSTTFASSSHNMSSVRCVSRWIA